MASEPTQEDARLLLQLYDLRREKVLRRARDFVQKDCKFKDYKDFVKRYPQGSKQSTYVGMVLGYWELACTLVARGLINESLFNATNFEHVALWFKFKPLAEGWRREYQYPDLMRSLETLASRHPGAAQYREPHKGQSRGSKKRAAAGREEALQEEPEDDE